MVAGLLDAASVATGSRDDARAGPVTPRRVEVLAAADVGRDPVLGTLPLLRGKAGPAARRRMMPTVRLNLTQSGSTPATVAAWQIRASQYGSAGRRMFVVG